jgi:hypothetical protein
MHPVNAISDVVSIAFARLARVLPRLIGDIVDGLPGPELG